MACDWCRKNKPLTRLDEQLYLCDDCKEDWGEQEFYSSRTEP